MEPWIWGLVLIAGLGLALIGYGILSDRTLHRARQRAAVSPPTREIPGLPPDLPAPTYLTAAAIAAERNTAAAPGLTDPTDPTDPTVESLQTRLDRATQSWHGGWTDPGFVTHPDQGWSVLSAPAVLLCAEPVSDLRELLPVIQSAAAVDRALLVATPEAAAEVVTTLALNAGRHPGGLLMLQLDHDTLDEVATATGAEPVDSNWLRADAVRTEQLGHCDLWLADSTRSWILPAGDSIEP
ncbi:hypothetical protein [Naumannella halotolerans]|uniref:Uncharacterized protein n=1 Tax=Naumannella halotolerans TaxID=993414 RepID=A0A4R7JCP8_9ACTN|nr:hypothetical protein [Naumannella halotolerans]TDT34487.1 hypothetical protein CLV29_2154 [Naumannella halotolerans]